MKIWDKNFTHLKRVNHGRFYSQLHEQFGSFYVQISRNVQNFKGCRGQSHPGACKLNPIRYFGPFKTLGGGRSASKAFSFLPELLEGVTCSKMNLQSSTRKSLQRFFSYILALRGNFGPICKGPPL